MNSDEIIHRRNSILFILISVFYFIQVIINIIVEGLASVFPPVYLFIGFGMILTLLIYSKVQPKFTMVVMVSCIYIYFYFLIKDCPCLVNFLFMWLGLPFSAIYQYAIIVILAGIYSIMLTYYGFFHLHYEIFPNVQSVDFVYIVLFGIFTTTFLLIFINKIRKANAKLQKLAYYDSLTGAANRLLLKEKFELQKEIKVHSLAILFIDMNGFKKVNDTYGHDVGDQLLEITVARLNGVLRGTDLLCRLGGDEFVILLSNLDKQVLENITARIQSELEKPIILNEQTITVSGSIGWSYTNDVSNADLDQMIKEADQAMYKVKHSNLVFSFS
ncbi:MAG TPA: GGDEF domain-containing protein [Ureibacillus sp.]|nr:GGDEF domain-containing protein [Ureibacillus sp.]